MGSIHFQYHCKVKFLWKKWLNLFYSGQVKVTYHPSQCYKQFYGSSCFIIIQLVTKATQQWKYSFRGQFYWKLAQVRTGFSYKIITISIMIKCQYPQFSWLVRILVWPFQSLTIFVLVLSGWTPGLKAVALLVNSILWFDAQQLFFSNYFLKILCFRIATLINV